MNGLNITIEFEAKNGACKMGSTDSIYTRKNYIDKEQVIKYVNQKLSEKDKDYFNFAKEDIIIKIALFEEKTLDVEFLYGKYNEEEGFIENKNE